MNPIGWLIRPERCWTITTSELEKRKVGPFLSLVMIIHFTEAKEIQRGRELTTTLFYPRKVDQHTRIYLHRELVLFRLSRERYTLNSVSQLVITWTTTPPPNSNFCPQETHCRDPHHVGRGALCAFLLMANWRSQHCSIYMQTHHPKRSVISNSHGRTMSSVFGEHQPRRPWVDSHCTPLYLTCPRRCQWHYE